MTELSLAPFAQLSLACYDISPAAQQAAVAAIPEMEWVASVGNPNHDCQAILARWRGYSVIGFCGTRFSEGPIMGRIREDLDNLAIGPIKWGRGYCARGYGERLLSVRDAIMPLVPGDTPIIGTGHSAGAPQAFLWALFMGGLNYQAIGFAGPHCADSECWAALYPTDSAITQVVRERDVFFDWPPLLWDHPRRDFVWLRNGTILNVANRPGLNLSETDHDPALYVKDCLALLATA